MHKRKEKKRKEKKKKREREREKEKEKKGEYANLYVSPEEEPKIRRKGYFNKEVQPFSHTINQFFLNFHLIYFLLIILFDSKSKQLFLSFFFSCARIIKI